MYEHDGTRHILCFSGLRDSKLLLTPFARSTTSLISTNRLSAIHPITTLLFIMSQGQLSQFSDHYPSSIFEDTPLDNLPFLPSDSVQSFPPDALYGNTSGSTPDIGFSHSQSLSPPEILERVGPLRKKKFALWTEMVNDEFVAWWLKTEFGSRINRNLF